MKGLILMAGGRPSVYNTKIEPHLKEIAILREHGVSDRDIANMLKIAYSTYRLHRDAIDEFSAHIKMGDESLVRQGKLSLLKMMTGYTKTKITKKYKYEDGIKVLVEENEIIEEVGPEPSSVFFGLVNKSNGEFQHRQEVKHTYDEEELKQVESFTDAFTKMMSERNEISNE